MKSNNIPSLLLALVLQVLPVTRVFLATSPVTGSSFAIVSTWIAGLAALMGSYNAVSGASTTITSPTTATGTNGTAFYYRITTGPMVASWFSAAPLPAGLACSSTTGRITGTPTVSGVFTVLLTATDGSSDPQRSTTANLALTLLAGGGGTTNPPSITTQPTNQTGTAGGSLTFTVVASGTGPLRYQWQHAGIEISGGTNSTLTLPIVTTNHVGNYAVVITNSVGSITSSTAVLTVLVPPSITTQPSNQSVTEGASPSFTVVAAGTATLGYQWRKSGVNVGGATSATLSFPSVTIGEAGSYTVVVTNSAGSITSSAVTLTVSAAPVAPSITTQPASRTVTNGGTTTFTVVAGGTSPFAYQWRTNGVELTGATNSTLTLPIVTTNHVGNYAVVITNSVGSITSSTAVLTVLVPPLITTQPSNQSVTEGASPSFTVVAAGTATLGYQWRKSGVNVGGATSATLSFPNVTIGEAGSYTVVVTNSAGSITSSAVTLTVSAAPVAPSITTQPTSRTVTNGGTTTFTVVAGGTSPFAYQWRTNGVELTGATNSTLTLSSITTNHVGNYAVVITNSVGSITSSTAVLTVLVPPSITTQPSNQSVTEGASPSFTVVAAGTATLGCQWRKSGVNVGGATSATLSFPNVMIGEAGSYSVVVSNSAGSITSSVATLTVNAAPVAPSITTQPTSRTATNGGGAIFTVVASGTATLNYQWRTNGVALPGATSATLTLSSITTNQAGNYTVVITNSVGSITSSTATLTVLVPPSVATQPSSQSVIEGASPSFTVSAAGTAPLGYQWRKSGVNVGGAISATLNFPNVTLGQAGSYSVVVSNSAGSITSSVATLTVNSAPVAPSITTQPTNQTGTVGGSVTLTVVAAGTGPLSYVWHHDGSAVTNGTTSQLNLTSLTTNDAGAYRVVITNAVGSITSAVATVTVNPAPVAPTITSQPESQTVGAGSNATFSVSADGTGPLRYQWRKGGVAVSGATNTTLNFAPAITNNAGNYTVVVTNIAGAVTSSVATLTVTVPPTPDSIRPTLAVLSPATALTTVTSNIMNFAGTAADLQGVTAVFITQNGGAETSATGTTTWTATAALQPGTNTFLIKATDAAGNVSLTSTRVVIYVVKLPLLLTMNGNGTVTGATNNQLLELGKTYALKATPKPGNVFSNWLVNGEASTAATLTFTMASNRAVIANFVTNPFVALKGGYTGLFYPETPEPPHEQSGHFTLTVTDKGTFSGKLLLAGASLPVSGVLDLSLEGSKTVLRRGTNEIVLRFRLSTGSDQVVGSVSNAFWNAELFGHRATFNTKLNPATNAAGKYTMVLPGGEDAATSPAGHSPMTLNLTTAGAVTLKGTLADGSAVAQKTTLAADGQTPVYVNLYKGKGSLIGWLTVMNTETNDTPGLLLWTKLGTAGGKNYLTGFTNETLTLGSRYVAPAKGVVALVWSNGVAVLEQGNLILPLTNSLTLTTANKFTITSTNTSKLALSLTASSGLLSGSFVHPDTLKKSTIKGVILQKQALGGGFFLGTNQSGSLVLGDEAVELPN